MNRALVTGAGGFIGHHLARHLVRSGYWVRGVDIKEPEYDSTPAQEFMLLDLREWDNCLKASQDVNEVYHLAADMGGIGFITVDRADVARNNALINVHMLEAARQSGIQRFLFTSSACVYPVYKQSEPSVAPLKEAYAWPAQPEPGYGLEKLFMEELCRYYRQDHRLETRIVRLHNVYGPLGTYGGGREKAPAAICRKVALARDGDEIEVWGDGKQTRSFMYVDDCVMGICRVMQCDYPEPLNLGTDELVTIDGLVDLVAGIAGKRIRRRYEPAKPQGVRGRNSDNTLVREVLGWEPRISLRDGLALTYPWIEAQVCQVECTDGSAIDDEITVKGRLRALGYID